MDVPQNISELIALVEEHGAEKVAKRFRKPPIPSQLLIAVSHETPPESVWVFLAQYVLTPSSLLEELAQENSKFPGQVLIPLSQNPRTPPTSLSKLMAHPERSVRAAVAANPNLPARDINDLLESKDTEVWQSLATNPALKFKVQAQLAAQGDAATRLALVKNKSLHPDLWIALSADPSPIVRFTLATASNAPDDLLPFWADSDREEIQLALLTRSSLPPKILKSLLLSPHASVRQGVREQLELDEVDLLYLSRTNAIEERQYVAALPGVSGNLQHQLAQDDDLAVRAALATNESIWPEVAEFLVTGEDEDACLAMLDNPEMPESLYVELAWLNKPRLVAALASSDNTPEEVLHYLVNDRLSAEAIFHLAACQRAAPWLRADLASALSKHTSPSLRNLAASATGLPQADRNRLRDDHIPRVRQAAYEVLPEPIEIKSSTKAAIEKCLQELEQLFQRGTHDETN
ncbi:MAG: hypothetical protein AAFX93_08745 [Verrucomicrobiota bacterium]